jgi:trigger factor
MEPAQFVQALEQGGQLPMIVGEVTRNKALAIALAKTTVVDQDGNAVDLSEFTSVDRSEDEVIDDDARDAESSSDAVEAGAAIETDVVQTEAPAQKDPAKKSAAKKSAAKKPAAKKDSAKQAAPKADAAG